jgi:hypothetical protein
VSLARGLAIGALVIGGALVVLSVLTGSRGALRELVTLFALVTLAFFAARAGWRWWKRQPRQIASKGLVGALGMVGVGWLLVAFVHACSRVSSENFGMIVVWPIVFLMGIAVTCGGLLAALVGVWVILTAATRAPEHRLPIIVGGGAAVVLNLSHVYVLVRLLFTG